MPGQVTTPLGALMESWVQSVGTLCWAQDQSEALLRTWMDQGQLAREDGLRLSAVMAEQARANQAELQKFIHHSVALSLDGLRRNHQAQLDAMQAQLDELGARLEKLRT